MADQKNELETRRLSKGQLTHVQGLKREARKVGLLRGAQATGA